MVRWMQTVVATALWGFAAAATFGLVEAAVHVARSGVPVPPTPLGTAGALVGAMTLAGWFGLAVAVVLVAPLVPVLWGRRQGPALAMALAVGGTIGLLVAILVGNLLQDAPLSHWWHENLGTLWLPKLGIAGVVGLVLGLGLRPLAARVVAGPRWVALAPAVLLVVVTVLWPDWRAMAARHQVGDLPRGAAPAEAENVVILSIDTLRRDKLSCLDPDAPPTPRLDALAARGRLFTNAWSVSPWTLPAMATVMTGQPPRALAIDRTTPLPDGVPTLAELARTAGWQTAAVVANPWLLPEFGFSRGFDHYDHSDVLEPLAPAAASVLAREITRYVIGSTEPADGGDLVAAAGHWLAGRDPDRPFLLWIHFMDPHLPYRTHPGQPGGGVPVPDHPLFAPDHFMNLDALRAMLPDVPAAVRDGVEALYDGEVVHADACIGSLLDSLVDLGVDERTWIVVLADHGEEFFEHGGFEHGHSLMPEVTGIPLIVRPPGGAPDGGVRDDRAVSLLDLMPSLAGAVGWPVPAEVPGRPALLDGGMEPTPLTVLENMLYGPPRRATLRWPDFRVVELESGHGAWYDLARDPGAQVPRPAPADADTIAAARRELLAAWDDLARRLGSLDRDEARLGEAAQRRLRSLGY
ncbi:sulfatase-like hydrolase/transferase [bacterium]|nr:sulfatase-like hydrolase/transferase [bacterium]